MKKIILAFLIPTLIFSQGEFSIHKLHKTIYQKKDYTIQQTADKKIEIAPINKSAKSNLSKVVFGYLPDWEYLANSHQYINFDLITHLVCFDFPADSNGNIKNPAGWPWTSLMNTAHANGVKNILGITNFEASEIRQIITDSNSKLNFILQVKNKVSAYSFDGVNIDFEGLYNADKSTRINSFMKELTDSLHKNFPGIEVSFAGPVINWGGYWDLKGLAESCDYIFIMGYAFYGSWSSTSGPNAPLLGGSRNLTTAMTNDYVAVVSSYPNKLILGLPYYGLQWETETENAYSTAIDFISSPRYRTAIAKAESNGKLWDNISKTAWTKWKDSEINQLWFDDDSSLGLKYDLAISKSLLGVGMWALGYDGDRTELWNLLAEKFASGTMPTPQIPTNFYITKSNSNDVVIHFNQVDYADWYEIFISSDCENFSKYSNSTSNEFTITGLPQDSVYFFKVRASNSINSSSFTEVLAVSSIAGSPWEKRLIVNGFDRISGTTNTFDFIKFWKAPMLSTYTSFESASNEAVINGKISLEDYSIIIWMLLDESTEDETFNATEQSLIKDYLNNGGILFVSGSEIGWDLFEKGSTSDKQFYNDYLFATYISDAPNNKSKTYYSVQKASGFLNTLNAYYNFDNGTHGSIDVDWPDAIGTNKDSHYMLYYQNTSIGAGIGFWRIFSNSVDNKINKVVYLAFPFETIYPDEDRIDLWKGIYDFLIYEPKVESEIIPAKYYLSDNYPNPFNPTTSIKYSLPEQQFVSLKIFDILGKEVASLVNENKSAGNYEVNFDASNLSSGVYFYQFRAGNFTETKKMLLMK